MKKLKVFTLCALSAALIAGCGKDKSTLNAADNRQGSVSIAASSPTLIDGVELKASVSDDDGITSEIRYQLNVNGFPITGATSAIYVVSDNYAGNTISVSAVYSDDAGFTETLISASTSEIVPLTSFGNLVATTTNDLEELVGSVSLNGVDVTVAASTLTTSYGTFSIDAAGAWVYNLNTSDATVAGLETGATITDEVIVEASDGTVDVLVIIITGAEIVVAPPNTGGTTQAAVIRDTDSGDTGELRYKFDAPMLAGKLTARFNKVDNAATADGTAKDAYITFYNESGSTGSAVVDLRIHAADFEIRDKDIDVTNVYTPGAWHDVEVTWDETTPGLPAMVTVTINGVSVTTEAFESANAGTGGVAAIAFRLADNSAVLAEDITFKVDDIAIYSDTAGSTLVFEDDFESYAEGHDLDQDPYNSSTFQAVVEVVANGGGAVTEANQFASITDTDSGDTGELRYEFDAPMLAGKLVARFNKDDNAATADGTAKDAYITFYNESGSTGSAVVDLRIHAADFEIRDKDIDVTNVFTPGAWHDVEVTWDETTAGLPASVTVTINGVSVTTAAFDSANAGTGGVAAIAFRLADNSAVLAEDITFKVDDVKIYSDTAGSTLLFEDDFEGYAVGTDLDFDNNADSPWDNSTFQAVVVLEM